MARLRNYCSLEENDLFVIEEAVHTMNERLILEWNQKVKSKDTIYFLGDLTYKKSPKRAQYFINRLNGNKCFIRGNHDLKIDRCTGLAWIKDVYFLMIKSDHELAQGGNLKIWLSHYPHLKWPESHYGAIHLHGHSHGNLYDDPGRMSFDVSYDANGGGGPYSLDTVLCNLDMKLGL
jgi:calcineurin-like phosphoesterase family protein